MKSLWKLQEESKSFLYKVNVWCLWLRGQKIHKSVRCYHFWFVIAANAKSKQSDLSLIKCFLFRYSYYLTIEIAVLQGGKLIYLKCVCVCVCVRLRVYIYITIHLFSPWSLWSWECWIWELRDYYSEHNWENYVSSRCMRPSLISDWKSLSLFLQSKSK